ncbi:MAG: DUF2029 domain-containing protein [Alphaproteobacteria bacterium]|nr:DUF2029 domain-containing protein [Alphaproteobacteria bacterium]
MGPNYRGVGTDWMVFYGAVESFRSGHFSIAANGDAFTRFLNQQFAPWLSAPLPYRPWVYPPSYLFLLLPFGLLPFLTAYGAFQLLTAAALFAAIAWRADNNEPHARTIALLVLLCPAASINAVDGQNAFLSAALLVGGIRLLEERPLLAGAVLGLATFKPQFAVLVPVALLAAGQWRALVAFVLSAVALAAASALVIGIDAWTMWFHASTTALVSPNPKWVEYGRLWGNSVWTCAVAVGASLKLADGLQLAALAVAAAFTAIAFRRQAGCRLAVLLTATLLAAPHWSPYDAVLLSLAAMVWAFRGPIVSASMWPWILVLALWLVPLMSPPILIPAGRMVPLLIVTFLAVMIRFDPALQPILTSLLGRRV